MVISIALLICNCLVALSIEGLVCTEPHFGEAKEYNNTDKKFLFYSCLNCPYGGIGNSLVSFPSSYFFAAASGRDILIGDDTLIGQFCKIYKCHYPFYSDTIRKNPWLATERPISLKNDKYLSNFKYDRLNQTIVYSMVFKNDAAWWITGLAEVKACISRLSGCHVGDITCYERYAFSKLLLGPFTNDAQQEILRVLKGMSSNAVVTELLTSPFSTRPRFDAAIHMRHMFDAFEKHTVRQQKDNVSAVLHGAEAADREAKEWLRSAECRSVFRMIEEALSIYFDNITAFDWRQRRIDRDTSVAGSLSGHDKFPAVLICVDSAIVRNALVEYLQESSVIRTRMSLVYVDVKTIVHTKNVQALSQKQDARSWFVDTVFDWVNLAGANVILGWRRQFTNIRSSFVVSADRASMGNIPSDGLTRVYYLCRSVDGKPTWLRPEAYGIYKENVKLARADAPFAHTYIK